MAGGLRKRRLLGRGGPHAGPLEVYSQMVTNEGGLKGNSMPDSSFNSLEIEGF